ncbi:hypothetical protein B0H14DRAFT_3514831 [Mycena olivaceomarginata]|nr:hypothetical protein B0H14DRAFT_3514831 [Mycena olivaceomarginata]
MPILSHHCLVFAIPHQHDASFHEPSRHALQLCRASLVLANLTDENPYWESLLGVTLPVLQRVLLVCPSLLFIVSSSPLAITTRREDPVGDFAVKYGARTAELGVPADNLYQALMDTAENMLPDWYTVGHQNTAWKTFGYIPTDWVDPSGSTGLPTREASRAWEYALGDFAVRQAAIALDKSVADVAKCTNRSMNLSERDEQWVLGLCAANGTFPLSPPEHVQPG